MPGSSKIKGHLEKKNDWIRRTRDFQQKKAQIKHLSRKAEERNPNEFHFHMVNSQVGLDGTHRELCIDSDDETFQQKMLGNIRDLQYVKYNESLERKKIEKLRKTLNLSNEDIPPGNRRTIFVDNIHEAKKKFADIRSLPSSSDDLRKTNKLSEDIESKAQIEKQKLHFELTKRENRAKDLRVVADKLEVKKSLALSNKSELKPKIIEEGNKNQAAHYKWPYVRKK